MIAELRAAAAGRQKILLTIPPAKMGANSLSGIAAISESIVANRRLFAEENTSEASIMFKGCNADCRTLGTLREKAIFSVGTNAACVEPADIRKASVVKMERTMVIVVVSRSGVDCVNVTMCLGLDRKVGKLPKLRHQSNHEWCLPSTKRSAASTYR
jgi:hypothetical protein